MTTTIDTLVPEQLWQAIQPLLPPPPRRYGGRSRVDDRAALVGIVYQLRTGIPWRLLPTRQLGCGSPVTCWRRLRDWQRAGVWQRPRKRPAKLHGDRGVTIRAVGGCCVGGGSARGLRGVASSRATSWAVTALWWSGRWRGWSVTGGCRCATSGARTSCWGSAAWPAR